MGIQKIDLSNFTVFEQESIDFCEGINILIGENGTGKTHCPLPNYLREKALILQH